MKNKHLITESMSSVAYHFCPLDSLFAIMKSKFFKLTDSENNTAADREKCEINGRRYRYYMCFSRLHSCLSGYARRRLESERNWRDCIVRITVDGDKFNQKFKTVPVNVYQDAEDKKTSEKMQNTRNVSKKKFVNPVSVQQWRRELQNFKPKKTFCIKNREGKLFKFPAEDSNALFNEIKKAFPMMKDEVIMKIMANKENYRNDDTNFPSFNEWKRKKDEEAALASKGKIGVFKVNDYTEMPGELNTELTSKLDKDSEFKQLREFEDRLLSDEEYIKAFPYIKRIDIYVSKEKLKNEDTIQKIGNILTLFNHYEYQHERSPIRRTYELPIYLYDSFKGFETNTDDISFEMLKQEHNIDGNGRFGEILNKQNKRNIANSFLAKNSDLASKEYVATLSNKHFEVISSLLSSLISIDSENENELHEKAKQLLVEHGFSQPDEISNILNELEYFPRTFKGQISANNNYKTKSDMLKANFVGMFAKYVGVVMDMFDDYMRSNGWGNYSFKQFQTALSNRYGQYTGVKLQTEKYRKKKEKELKGGAKVVPMARKRGRPRKDSYQLRMVGQRTESVKPVKITLTEEQLYRLLRDKIY